MKALAIGCLVFVLFVPQAVAGDQASKPAASQAEKPPLTDEELDAIVAKHANDDAPSGKRSPGCAMYAFGRTERLFIVAPLKGGKELKVLLASNGFDPKKWVNLPAWRVIRAGGVAIRNGAIYRCPANERANDASAEYMTPASEH